MITVPEASSLVDTERNYSEDQYAMPIILRLERDAPAPYHEDALIAAMLGVIKVIERGRDDDNWRHAVITWMCDDKHRKVTRKARGARWTQVSKLPGVEVQYGIATVRVLVPHLIAETPVEVSRLQVSGINLEYRDDPNIYPATESAFAVAVNPYVLMSTGKQMAQVSHAAHYATLYGDLPPEVIDDRGEVRIRIAEWEEALEVKHAIDVKDAGYTEVPPGTVTVKAWFSYKEER